MRNPPSEEKLEEAAERVRELKSTAQLACLEFLRVELKLAHTLLDLAETAKEPAARERRIAIAAEAATVVERFVATHLPEVSSLDEARGLTGELNRVKERLTLAR